MGFYSIAMSNEETLRSVEHMFLYKSEFLKNKNHLLPALKIKNWLGHTLLLSILKQLTYKVTTLDYRW